MPAGRHSGLDPESRVLLIAIILDAESVIPDLIRDRYDRLRKFTRP
jgi:hypothetical protein